MERTTLIRLAKAAGLLGLLTACADTGPQPYYLANWRPGDSGHYAVDSFAPQKGPNGLPTFSVCYSRMFNTVEEIRQLVAQNCTNPGLMENRVDLYGCSVSAPVRATFSCDRLSREAAEARSNLNPNGSFIGSINLF